MAVKLSKHMTRVVAIGNLDKYELTTTPFTMGKGVLDIDGTKVRFTLFNNDKEGVSNPHTKAADFAEQFKEGDTIYITGSDNRSYSEDKDTYYEDIQGWDYRLAEEGEIHRWVYVYVGDVKSISKEEIVLSFVNYRDKEMLFHINPSKANVPHGLEVGDRIKTKGTITNGLVTDFYGDGEFKTMRNAVEIKLENTKAEIEADAGSAEGNKDESGLW